MDLPENEVCPKCGSKEVRRIYTATQILIECYKCWEAKDDKIRKETLFKKIKLNQKQLRLNL